MSKLLFNLLNVSFPGRTTPWDAAAAFGSTRSGDCQPTTIKIMTTIAVTAT